MRIIGPTIVSKNRQSTGQTDPSMLAVCPKLRTVRTFFLVDKKGPCPFGNVQALCHGFHWTQCDCRVCPMIYRIPLCLAGRRKRYQTVVIRFGKGLNMDKIHQISKSQHIPLGGKFESRSNHGPSGHQAPWNLSCP